MAGIVPAEAVQKAREALKLEPSVWGRAWRVRRMDRPGEAYYLVELGAPLATLGVATVDVGSGEVGVYASLPGVGSHVNVDGALAAELAGGGESAELVWMPCSLSRSPLYPFWEVKTGIGTTYVDFERRVVEGIAPAAPGG